MLAGQLLIALMGLNERQVRRMCAAYEAEGAFGLISRRRGKPSNNHSQEGLREQAMTLIRERYSDFGPTLATEKLIELHGLRISRETVRQWMKDAGLWLTRKQRVPRLHQPRERRACLGELIQIDGSPHAWFEERGPDCSLLVYVAAGTPAVSFFAPAELLALAREVGFKDARHVSAADHHERYFAGRNDGLRPSSGEDFLVATT